MYFFLHASYVFIEITMRSLLYFVHGRHTSMIFHRIQAWDFCMTFMRDYVLEFLGWLFCINLHCWFLSHYQLTVSFYTCYVVNIWSFWAYPTLFCDPKMLFPGCRKNFLHCLSELRFNHVSLKSSTPVKILLNLWA